MEFRRVIKKVELLSPPDFESESQEIEYREDPLTGSVCILNTKRARRISQSQKADVIPGTLVRESRSGCLFCPEQIEEKTPRFPADISPAGRIRKGACAVFPNLFPFAEHHAVATFTDEHFLNLTQFTPEMIADNMQACKEWMLAVQRINQAARYPMYIWNHLPPAGASIVHPHAQALMQARATTMQHALLVKSKEYFRHTRRNYWIDLVDKEKELGERYIGENDSLSILSSYAPRGFREILLIFKDVSTFTALDAKQTRDFADAAANVLACYAEMGVGSFNVNSFSAPTDQGTDHYLLNVKIISRPFPGGLYMNDTGVFERLQGEWVIESLPEDIAAIMKRKFQAQDDPC